MRLLIVVNSYWNIYNFRLRLLHDIQSHFGGEIHLLAPADDYQEKCIVNKDFFTHTIKMSASGTNPLVDSLLIGRLRKKIKGINPDVILTYTIKPNIYASIAARFNHIPVINNVSGLGTVFIKESMLTKLVKILYRSAFRQQNHVFFQNRVDKDLFEQAGLLKKCSSSIVPGSGVDTALYQPSGESRNRGLHFLFVGRLIKDKGIFEFLEAAEQIKKKYPQVCFNVVGQLGADNKTALSQAEFESFVDKGVVNYLGVSSDMKQTLASYDVVVLPSYREGMSKALLEAASMAKPIITTDVPGCKDIVEHDCNGLLCKLADANDLAKQIEKMILLSEERRIEMGEHGRKKMINEFDESIVIKLYIEQIAKMITSDTTQES